MQTYIAKRLLLAVPTVLAVMTIVFFSLYLAPGDPVTMMIPPDLEGEAREAMVEQIRERLGFDRPLHEQYLSYLGRTLRLDLGRSLRHRTPIVDDLRRRIPATLQLGVFSLSIAVIIGVAFGIISAVRRDTLLDNVTTFGALFGVSIPNFFFGYVLMLILGLYLRKLPPSGFGGAIYTWEGFRYAILPAITLGTSSAAVLARFTRSSMLDVINQDYIRTARAKGLADRIVIFRHALRNALIPVVTLLGMQFGSILSGSVIVESVFAWPGVGRYMIGAINSRDYPVVQATVLVVAIAFVLANFITDLAYAVIDPRIRYE